jgi:signal transduction histidine kinase
MTNKDQVLVSELNDALKQVTQGRKGVHMPTDRLPEDPEIRELQLTVVELVNQFNQNYDFILDLAKGRLDTVAPQMNSLATPFKQLQAELKHLTWQIRQISEGDLEQKVSFSGDFSHSINKMIESLRENRRISELNEQYLHDLLELNANKDKLFSIIAHDLKNPFSGILNLSDMVLNDVRSGRYDDIEEYAALLKAFSLQGYKLLVNLLDWARVQSNTIALHLEPVSLSLVLDDAKALNEPVAIQKKIRLQFALEDDFRVMADTNMLQTVLRNLMSNAVKFTRVGGEVTVSAVKSANAVEIAVRDNGVGIRPDNLKRLFRIDSPFSTNGTDNEIGSGLGLLLCRDFLRKMDSEIQVESEFGKGSTFRFTLPQA